MAKRRSPQPTEPVLETVESVEEVLPTEEVVEESAPEVEEIIEEAIKPKATKKKVEVVQTTTPNGMPYLNKSLKPAYEPAKPKGHIVPIGQDEVTIPGEDVGHGILVTENVYKEVQPRNSKRISYILLYPKGAVVPKHQTKKFGLL